VKVISTWKEIKEKRHGRFKCTCSSVVQTRTAAPTQLPWNPVLRDKCGDPRRNLLAYHCYTNTKCLCYTHVGRHGGSNNHIFKRNQPARMYSACVTCYIRLPPQVAFKKSDLLRRCLFVLLLLTVFHQEASDWSLLGVRSYATHMWTHYFLNGSICTSFVFNSPEFMCLYGALNSHLSRQQLNYSNTLFCR
jgi:hypothetical protein